MKQKILNCLKFGILVFGISLVLFNCQTDNSDELIQFEKGNNTAFKKGKLQDYDDLSTYIENLKRRRASIISSAESDIEDAYDFTIIQDQDMQIYDEGGSITYNIPIHKTNEEVDIFSNLVIKFSDIEPTQAFILNYEPYDGYFEDVEQNSQTPFSGYVSSQLLEYDGSLDGLAETDGGCITVTTKYCDWENNQHGAVHIATSNCTEGYMFYVSTTYCFGDAPQLVDVPSPSSSGFPYIPSGGGSSGDSSYEHPVIIPTVPSISREEELKKSILDCINTLSLNNSDTTTIDPEILEQLNLTLRQWTVINDSLNENGCSEEVQEDVIEFLENVFVYPYPHCSSFEYAKPPNINIRACAVTNLTETFYAYGRLNGQVGTITATVNYSLVFFVMPTWMTNGQAATSTAIAVNNALNLTKNWFLINYEASESEIITYLDFMLIEQMALFAGTKTDFPPFTIPSPAPYVTSLLSTGNCN